MFIKIFPAFLLIFTTIQLSFSEKILGEYLIEEEDDLSVHGMKDCSGDGFCDIKQLEEKTDECAKRTSVFSERTDDIYANQLFEFYGSISEHKNMLEDHIRVATYQKAILSNGEDFFGKTVLDVGAGSGLLSFFAAQAGARKVYAVEASSMAQHTKKLVAGNNFSHVIEVINGKIEEIDLPEEVDIIISETLGNMLYNERTLETFLHAKKWLKTGGIVFPSRGNLHIAPFTDEELFKEMTDFANFWDQKYFYGIDLTAMKSSAFDETFGKPIADTFHIDICTAKSFKHSIDYGVAKETDLQKIVIPVEFKILKSGMVHGLAFWFDVAFIGSKQTVWLSTSPTEELTHWYQIRCLLRKPLFAKKGQILEGTVTLKANRKLSHYITIELSIAGDDNLISTNTLDLRFSYFRFKEGQGAPPVGSKSISPSEEYWKTLDDKHNQLN